MSELEKIKHAKTYIDELAKGINPETGEVIPEDTVLKNGNLSECFFLVSNILNRVIDNGGFVNRSRSGTPVLPPFTLPQESHTRVEITTEPTMIKRFTDRINSLVDDNAMRKLKVTALTKWLVDNGFLFEEIIDDKKRKKPTIEGEKLGIFSEHRKGQYGNYLAILYSENAQRHIVNNLNEIIAISNGV